MKNSKPSAGIKRKIIAGFLLLLTLIFVSVYSVIKLSSKLTPPDPSISSSVTKLTITSNLLSSIIQSDGYARAFINTGDSVYLNNYRATDKITLQLIDSLTYSSLSNTNQFLRIITVDSLLDLKRLTYSNFFALRQFNVNKKSVDLGRIIPKYPDSVRVSNRTVSKTITQNYPLQPVKKKGFFTRIWSGITGKSKSDSTQRMKPPLDVRYDTILTYKAVRDTTLSQVKSQLRKIEARENLVRQQSTEREMMLLQADQDIMNEIRAILLLYEKEEIAKAIAETQTSRDVLKNLWTSALFLAMMGLVSTIAFIILIWKDLARSAFYRKQLEEARSLAEELLKVKEQFLANMSHEIRTPLTSIIGFSERLNETKVDMDQARYIRYINSSSEHLLELINDLLDFSRIGSGKLTLEEKPFNPASLLEEAFETLAPKAKSKGLEPIIKQSAATSINLIGDPLRLKQIVINLLNNSIKFTEKGKVILESKIQVLPDNKGAILTIRIADTGIGIPRNKQNMIFEEFSQVDHSITRKYGGSGLGLAITKKLVEMMNGTITLLSREEQGTIFTVKITLPVSEKVLESNKDQIALIQDLSELSILLAEDDDTTRMLIKELLEKHNANVTAVSNGLEAFVQYQQDPSKWGVVITDIQMPGLSGPEFIEKVKGKCAEVNIKPPVFICLTAHADQNEIESYRRQGIDHFILKPFKNSEILKALNYQALATDKKNRDLANDSTIKIKEAESQENIPETTNQKISDGLDLSAFRKFAGDDDDSLQKILSSLETNIARTSEEMVMAYNRGKFPEISVLAHRLIPNIKSLGVTKTATLLRNIEDICKDDEIDELALSELFSKCILELNRVRKKLRNIQLSST